AVRLGCHLLDEGGHLLDLNHWGHGWSQEDPQPVPPRGEVHFEARVPAPARGRYQLVFDLGADPVRWFEVNGSATVRGAGAGVSGRNPLAVSDPRGYRRPA